jgi:hypothetical protein
LLDSGRDRLRQGSTAEYSYCSGPDDSATSVQFHAVHSTVWFRASSQLQFRPPGSGIDDVVMLMALVDASPCDDTADR